MQMTTPTNKNARVAPLKLKALVRRIFVYNGLPDDHAEIATHALVKASLRGVDSHGVARVPMYCERLRRKVTNPIPEITVTRVAPAVAQVDGDNGLGLVVGNRAMHEAIAIAKEFGTGLAGVKRSGHYGMAA